LSLADLDRAFGMSPADKINFIRAGVVVLPGYVIPLGLQDGSARPVRLKPGVPVMRDREHQARHRKRKAARAARRRNRK